MQSFSLKRKKVVPDKKHSIFKDQEEEELDSDVDWLTATKRPKDQEEEELDPDVDWLTATKRPKDQEEEELDPDVDWLTATKRPKDQEEEELDPDVDWLTATKRPKYLLLEDKISKSKRLCSKGIILAEEERWWEAINYWGEAVTLTPENHEIHEMVAQAYMKVGEIFPAVRSATLATEVAPLWWPGHQTLGRAQLGIGEVSLAIKSFSKAIHLAPSQIELWKEDLEWAVNLRTKQMELKQEDEEQKLQNEKENSLILEEIKDIEEEEAINSTAVTQMIRKMGNDTQTDSKTGKDAQTDIKTGKDTQTGTKLSNGEGHCSTLASTLDIQATKDIMKGPFIRFKR